MTKISNAITTIHSRYFRLALAALAAAAGVHAQTKWVATWATAPEPLVSAQSAYNPPTPSGAPANSGLANNSVRQVLRVSIGGDTLRMRFTNEYTNVPVRINAATIAVSAGSGLIDTTTTKFFKFNGNDSVTMPANAYVWSDAMAFNLAPGSQVQITLYLGPTPTSGSYPGMTVHRGSRTVPRVLMGNHVTDRAFTGAATITMGSWVISSMEVRAPQSAGAVAILGNSITDGLGVTIDGFNRWSDALTTNLLAHASTNQVGVLNGGIGAGNLLTGGTSTPGMQRYKRDLFDHSGVKWVMILLAVNDIGNSGCSMTTSNNVIAAYTTIADSAHARGLKVYGATLTPFGGNSYYSANSEGCRSRINAWVRTTALSSGKYDAVVDFDKLLRIAPPGDTTRMQTTYYNDGLHPNIAGYAAMGNFIDTSLFAGSGTAVRPGSGSAAGYALEGVSLAGARASIRFALPRETVASFRIYTTRGKEVATVAARAYAPGPHEAAFDASGLAGGIYLVSMRAEGFTATRTMALTGR
jgi:lysophospholipase L1-like esterase